MENQKHINTKPEFQSFSQRLDFYWQFIAVYALALLAYSLLKGTIVNYTISIVLKDPVVILLLFFMCITAISLALNSYKKRSIIIGKNFITFKSRLGEKRFEIDKILRIAIAKEKVIRIRRRIPVIKISVKDRKRIIRIRPSTFWNDKLLVQSITQLKKQFAK